MLQMWRQTAKIFGKRARVLCLTLALPAFLGWFPVTATAQKQQAIMEARSKAFYQYLEQRGAEISQQTLSNIHTLQQLKNRDSSL